MSNGESIAWKPPRGGGGSSNSCSGAAPPGDSMESWLRGLDGGRGTMLKYQETVKKEFRNLSQIATFFNPDGDTSSVLTCVHPMIFSTLGIQSLGHKLMFAK